MATPFSIPGSSAGWQEVLNTGAGEYGGSGMLNGQVVSGDREFTARLPANSVIVFQRQ